MTVEEKIEKISKKISSKILFDYNLKKLNWFNLGGSAKVFFKPDNLNDLVLFLKEFSSNLPIKVIGAGSNILVRDGGFNGVIIKLGKNFSHLSKLDNGTIVSGASVLDKKLSDFALENSIGGFEFFSCIPGSVGGAIRMNSGCYQFDVSKCLISIQSIDYKGNVKLLMSKDIKFHYRGSNLPDDLIFLSATFKGTQNDKKTIKKKIENFIESKKKSQPSQIKTCGSTFKNPFDQTTKKAWELIKESDCNKMKVGGAYISDKHFNFFVNDGTATSLDMELLIEKVKEGVIKKTGIKLDLELQIIGENI